MNLSRRCLMSVFWKQGVSCYIVHLWDAANDGNIWEMQHDGADQIAPLVFRIAHKRLLSLC